MDWYRFRFTNSLPLQNLNCDPLSPEVEIKALAGPMSKDQAKVNFENHARALPLKMIFN